MLSYVAFRSSSRSLRVAERGESLLALAALVSAYGVGELVGGYGFLSVFVCAMTFRSAERAHDYHAAMHEVAERLERLLTLFVLLVLGIALSRGLLEQPGLARGRGRAWRWCSWSARSRGCSPCPRWPAGSGRRWTAGSAGPQPSSGCAASARSTTWPTPRARPRSSARDWLWSTVSFTIVLSVFVHGVLASPVMKRIGVEPAAESAS